MYVTGLAGHLQGFASTKSFHERLNQRRTREKSGIPGTAPPEASRLAREHRFTNTGAEGPAQLSGISNLSPPGGVAATAGPPWQREFTSPVQRVAGGGGRGF